jgi:hypothetical protein
MDDLFLAADASRGGPMLKENPDPALDVEWLGQADDPVPEGAARYIADMTAELARLARTAQLGVLAYLLDMAATEARSTGAEDREQKRVATGSG